MMMKRVKSIRHILSVVLLLPLLLTACVREVWPNAGEGSDELVISFTAATPTDVVVSTKGTLDPREESKVYNIYVLVFDDTGDKMFGHFYEYDHLEANVSSGEKNYWKVTSNDPASPWNGKTHGEVHLVSAKTGNNYKVVAIANINSEIVNISKQSMDQVLNWSQMVELTAGLQDDIISRGGYFPMCGQTEVSLVNGNWPTSGVSIPLKRLDAKVEFNVQVKMPATSTENAITSFTPLKWWVVNLPKRCSALEFGAWNANTTYKQGDEAWEADGSTYRYKYATPSAGHALTESDYWELKPANANHFFTLKEMNFEKEESSSDTWRGSESKIPIHSFSFYMLENRTAPKANPTNNNWEYIHREKKSGGHFAYADDLATYVVITGRIEMKGYKYNGATTNLGADVQYIIHLGDFGDSDDANATHKYSNFSVLRNHTYKYNIYIQGVDNIRVEVEDEVENDAGATGDITISRDEILECDSHYVSHVLDIHQSSINLNELTWRVKTPFNKEGKSPRFDGDEVGLDCQWVEFRVNEKPGTTYSANRRQYIPRPASLTDKLTETMNITELVQFLKEEKQKYDNGTSSAFDADGKISVTIFVNEYFYEGNPLDGTSDPGLWKKFVNQPPREMDIIYSQRRDSPDKESHLLGSTFSIRQYSIQSVYNVNKTDLLSAWGAETLIDNEERQTERGLYSPSSSPSSRDNQNPNNGRINSMIEWGLATDPGVLSTTHTFSNPGNSIKWSEYLNLTATNSQALMVDTKRYPRYSCMSRNRDLDGDGVIDENEIRWYMAASNQLISLFLGGNGIERKARLYTRTPEQQASANELIWRQHYLASDKGDSNSDNCPRIVWAEEGMNGSNRNRDSGNWKKDGNNWSTNGGYAVRCVRDFGVTPTGADINAVGHENDAPEPLITVKRYVRTHKEGDPNNQYEGPYDVYPGESNGTFKYFDNKYEYFEFDCSNVNENSLRVFTKLELPKHNENDDASNLSKKFVTAPARDIITKVEGPLIKNSGIPDEYLYSGYKEEDKRATTYISLLNNYLDKEENREKQNPACPDGYRLPNVREATVFLKFLTSTEASGYLPQPGATATSTANDTRRYMFTRTQWALSNKTSGSWGWICAKDKMMMGMNSQNDQRAYAIRCVKDVE